MSRRRAHVRSWWPSHVPDKSFYGRPVQQSMRMKLCRHVILRFQDDIQNIKIHMEKLGWRKKKDIFVLYFCVKNNAHHKSNSLLEISEFLWTFEWQFMDTSHSIFYKSVIMVCERDFIHKRQQEEKRSAKGAEEVKETWREKKKWGRHTDEEKKLRSDAMHLSFPDHHLISNLSRIWHFAS